MARFIGFLKGSHGEVSRLGEPASGMSAEARGWNIGGKVYANADDGKEDTVKMCLTGGSNGAAVPHAAVLANGQSVSVHLENVSLEDHRGETCLRAAGRYMAVQVEGDNVELLTSRLFETREAAEKYLATFEKTAEGIVRTVLFL